MTYATYIAQSQDQLKQHKFDPAIIYMLIYEFHPAIKTLLLLTDYLQDELDNEIKTKIDNALNDLILHHKPLVYILGYTWFLGVKFNINENVLIPRIETEYWVDKLIEILDGYPPMKILDLCCGSGVIGLSIKRQLSRMQVHLSDISDNAISNTIENAEHLKLNVNIIKSNLFENLDQQKFDAIICNPPYIDMNAKLDSSVNCYEPHLALFADNKGMWFYEQILNKIKNHLNEQYLLVFEIGYNQANDVVALIKQTLGVTPTIWKDQFNNDRVVFYRGK